MKIRVAFTLSESGASPSGRAELLARLRDLGFDQISEGRATVSAAIGEDAFSGVFGATVAPIAPRPPGGKDYGHAGGSHLESAVEIPPVLAPYVRTVSLTPPAIRLAGSQEALKMESYDDAEEDKEGRQQR